MHKYHQVRRIKEDSILEVMAVYALVVIGLLVVGFCLALAFAPIVVQ